MSIFGSLNWFKSKKREEIEEKLVATNRAISDLKEVNGQLFKLLREREEQTTKVAPDKLYKKLKMVDGLLTIVLHGGEILKKPNATPEDFKKAKEATVEMELINMCSSPEGLVEIKEREKEIANKKALLKGIELLENLSDFELRDGSVYLKSANGQTIERSLPQLLIERFIEVVGTSSDSTQESLNENTEYQSLKKFWLKCCLNPNARSAEDLYEFLKYHNMKIDKHGNFYTYRRVDSKEGTNKELVDFVSNTYNKVKAVWKKNVANFDVYSRLGDYMLIDLKKNNVPKDDNPYWERVGNLKELYENLPNMQENSYTSRHTGLEDYKVGEVISMPRYEGDDNNKKNCSKGFHQASKMYDYSGFGNTPILAIVNPIDVLAVPLNEVGKLRVCRWFFAMTLPEEEKYILDDSDFDVTDLGDIFEEKCSQDLQNYVQNSIGEEVKRHTFTIPEISASEITTIVSSLENMKSVIASRVSVIDVEEEE